VFLHAESGEAMIELLLTLLIIVLVCQIVFAFVPGVDSRLIWLIILIIALYYVFGHRGFLR
jgi:fatty acid desaturase